MSKERRGGARLEKNLSAKDTTSGHKQTSAASTGQQGQAKAGLSRNKKIILIVAAALAFAAVLGVLISVAVNGLWGDGGILSDGLPDVPTYQDMTEQGSGDMPVRSEADSVRKEGFYTFLVVGRDTGGGGNTDTIMLCSYDIPNQKLTVMSIPRDTMVDARHPDKNKKINGVWNLGLYYAEKGSEKKGIDYLKEAVGEMTGVAPDFYVIVNWEAFGRLVDTIGGVDFEVPFDMKYKDPTQNLVIDQAGGYRHLSGDDAMQVVRWRHNNSGSVQYADADLGRIRTQQALLKEIIKKCLRIESLTKIGEFVKIFAEEVETDLTAGNLLAFAQRAMGGLEEDNVVFLTIPLSSTNAGGYVFADPDQLLGVMNESFNPYVKELEMEELRVMQYSSSRGYYVYQGTGTGTAPNYSTDIKPAQAATVTPTPSPSAAPSQGATNQPSATPSASASPSTSPEPSGSNTPSPSSGGESTPAPSTSTEPTTPPPAVEPTHDPSDLGIPMD